jgi:hypothetical protein
LYLKGKTPGNNQVPFYHSFASGIGAGAISAFLATPLDGKIFYLTDIMIVNFIYLVVKTRLQTLENKTRYSGIIDCTT